MQTKKRPPESPRAAALRHSTKWSSVATSLVADSDELSRRDAHERGRRIRGRLLVQHDLQALLGCPAGTRRDTARRARASRSARRGPTRRRLRRTWGPRRLRLAGSVGRSLCPRERLRDKSETGNQGATELASAVGEVELPHRRARAVPPSRDRELQGDAGRPHTPHGTHQAAVPQSFKLSAGATLAHRRRRAPWRQADKPLSVRSQYDAEG